MAAAAQTSRRRETLNRFADERIAFDAEAEKATAEAEARDQSAGAKRKQTHEMARQDVELYAEVVHRMEQAIDQFDAAEKERHRIAGRLLHVQGLGAGLAQSAFTRRLGDYLSRRLFALYRLSNLGRIELNAGGNMITSSFAGAERAWLTKQLDHEFGDKK